MALLTFRNGTLFIVIKVTQYMVMLLWYLLRSSSRSCQLIFSLRVTAGISLDPGVTGHSFDRFCNNSRKKQTKWIKAKRMRQTDRKSRFSLFLVSQLQGELYMCYWSLPEVFTHVYIYSIQ